jgi:hypothetical protein
VLAMSALTNLDHMGPRVAAPTCATTCATAIRASTRI